MFARGAASSDFLIACEDGDLAVVAQYIAENADKPDAINVMAAGGASAIYKAAIHGHAHIVAALLKVPELYVKVRNCVGATPIFAAAFKGHTEIVKLLIADKRTDINVRTDFGDIPLRTAIVNGHTAVVKLLLNAGAKVNDFDEYEQIATACNYAEIKQLLLDQRKRQIQFHQIAMFTLPYLSEHDQLSLRRTSRQLRDAIRDNQTAPWLTKSQFCKAVSGTFTNDNHLLKATLTRSWQYYCEIINNDNNEDAILHKLRGDEINFFYTVKLKSQMTADGRVYSPRLFHNWSTNAVWMLANIHKGRAFVIISPLHDKYLHRVYSTASTSAFAREIAAAMQAGYTVSVLNDRYLKLTPPAAGAHLKVKMSDMKLSHAEVRLFYQKSQTIKDNQPPAPTNNSYCVMQ